MAKTIGGRKLSRFTGREAQRGKEAKREEGKAGRNSRGWDKETSEGSAKKYHPFAGQWVYSHDAVVTSGAKSANNHNRACLACPTCSDDGKWCADVKTMVLSLENDPPFPKRRFEPISIDAIKARTKVIAGPATHWEFVSVVVAPDLRKVTVTVKGFTKPQVWQVSLPVQEFHP